MTGPLDDADRELIERRIRHDDFGVATSSVLRLLDVHDAATATLERVRALATEAQDPKYGPGGGCIYPGQLLAALAGQPEAPKEQEPLTYEDARWCDQQSDHDMVMMKRDLSAAKARIAELESLFQQTHGCHVSWVQRATEADAAKARADAAEKDADHLRKVFARELARADAAGRSLATAQESNRALLSRVKALEVTCKLVDWDDAIKHVQHTQRELESSRSLSKRLETERDQLAARVKELTGPAQPLAAMAHSFCCIVGDGAHYLDPKLVVTWFENVTALACTPEERAVLEAIKRDHPTLYAHEANRAAKAKRGGA